MDKGEHYDVQITEVDEKGGIMMCKLKGQMDKGVHYDVANYEGGCKRCHYDVQFKRVDG